MRMRTITLNNKVMEIDQESWPFICSKSLTRAGVSYFLGARQHRDGRVIVYGTVLGEEECRTGELLDNPNDEDLLDSLANVACHLDAYGDPRIVDKLYNKCLSVVEGRK